MDITDILATFFGVNDQEKINQIIEKVKKLKIVCKKSLMLAAGFEPATFRSKDQRSIHSATESLSSSGIISSVWIKCSYEKVASAASNLYMLDPIMSTLYHYNIKFLR